MVYTSCCIKWFANYLTNRKQYTCMKDASSTLSNVNCGVPKGSVLGPLLFLVCVNDIASAVPAVRNLNYLQMTLTCSYLVLMKLNYVINAVPV